MKKGEFCMEETNIIKKYEKVLMACPLLAGIPTNQYEDALTFLQAKVVHLAKHEILQQLDAPFRYAGIVLSGSIEGSFINENDAKISINRFDAGKLYGEALGCVQPPHSPIQLEALQNSLVLLVNLSAMHQEKESLSGFQYHLAMNLIHGLAHQNIYQNYKVRILSQKKLRDRIGIFLHGQPRGKDGSILVKLTVTAMAEFLGANRSALSRELGLMQDEGLLRIEGRRFFLTQP